MKPGKIIARIGLWSMFASGVTFIVSEIVFLGKTTNFSPLIIWGYGNSNVIIIPLSGIPKTQTSQSKEK